MQSCTDWGVRDDTWYINDTFQMGKHWMEIKTGFYMIPQTNSSARLYGMCVFLWDQVGFGHGHCSQKPFSCDYNYQN